MVAKELLIIANAKLLQPPRSVRSAAALSMEQEQEEHLDQDLA